ncbi:hypothetical protein F0365_11530 [Nonlabens sp. Ci31]|jgi:hypothetical protein|uniref:hypothetical protein n=1 Tax=Nonlabens sp. Ci31 TaxID=2608253 RepID=UPI0014644C0C|nr:hypothetical protein [Nonlabens sp. Ci31]QJP34975.1 hypothetical protein F0365_11530 [Nonlabens sp. Ci31]
MDSKTKHIKTLDLDFGDFELYTDVIIGRIKEGIHFNLELNNMLADAVISYYGENYKLGYISIRENSYSIDPMVHLHNTKHNDLCCISIVETKAQGMSSVPLESKFFKPGKLKSFPNKEEALLWTHKELLDCFNGSVPNHRMN